MHRSITCRWMAAGLPGTVFQGKRGGKEQKKKEFSLCAAAHHMPGIRGPELGEAGEPWCLGGGGHRKCERQSSSVLVRDFSAFYLLSWALRTGRRGVLFNGCSFEAMWLNHDVWRTCSLLIHQFLTNISPFAPCRPKSRCNSIII